MAASSNSSLSGSSVSSGKFLQRTPHFSPPSILAGSYLSAERLAVPLSPTARQALPQPRAGAPRGGGAPARGRLSLRRHRRGKPGRGKRGGARYASQPPCRAFVWGEGVGSPASGSFAWGSASLLAREGARPRPPRLRGRCGTGSSRRGAWGEEGIQRPTRILCRGPHATGLAPYRASARRGAWGGRGLPGVPLGGCCEHLAFSVLLHDWEQLNSRSRFKMLQVTDCPRLSGAGVRRLCLLWVLGMLGGRRCGAALCPAHGVGLAALQTRRRAEKLRRVFNPGSLKLKAVIQEYHCLLLRSRTVTVIFKL